MPDNVPAPLATKAKRGRNSKLSQGKSVMENITENMMGSITENMTENADEIVDDMKGNSKKTVEGRNRNSRQGPLKE